MDEKACKYKEIYEYWNYDTDDGHRQFIKIRKP